MGKRLQSYIRHLRWDGGFPCRHGICVTAVPITASDGASPARVVIGIARCVEYREEPHAPLLDRLATQRDEGGTVPVPVLVHGSHRFIDSTAILMHADADAVCGGDILYPSDAAPGREVAALEEQFDTQLV